MVAVDLDAEGAVLGVEILGAVGVEVEGRPAQPSAPPAEPKAGDRLDQGDGPGTLIRCRACSGDGLLLQLDNPPPRGPEPLDPAPPAEVRTEPAKALLADILAVVNRHQGRNAEQAMEEIHEACMASIDRAAIPPAEVRTEWGYRWTKPNGDTYMRACEEEDAREQASDWPDRAQVVSREVRVGPWTPAPQGETKETNR